MKYTIEPTAIKTAVPASWNTAKLTVWCVKRSRWFYPDDYTLVVCEGTDPAPEGSDNVWWYLEDVDKVGALCDVETRRVVRRLIHNYLHKAPAWRKVSRLPIAVAIADSDDDVELSQKIEKLEATTLIDPAESDIERVAALKLMQQQIMGGGK